LPTGLENVKAFASLPLTVYRYLGGAAAFRVQLARLKADRDRAAPGQGRRVLKAVASAGWFFPIYSHTFVYQELTQLIRAGFRLKFFYGAVNENDPLSPQFAPLWQARHRLAFHPAVCRRSIRYFRRRTPERFEALIGDISAQSGLAPDAVMQHPHIGQACAFARLVEAYRPDYLHSYFFYQDTVYALVASALLDIPRGVSCYADHMLDDYELKLVPLHLRQASVVVATSQRIRDELLAIEPAMPPARVLVKVNAINAEHFPLVARAAPAPGQPLVLVSVCRIEPKKGLLYMLDALHELRSGGLAVAWTVIGGIDGSDSSRAYADAVRDRIATLDLENVVSLMGKQSEAEINRAFAESHLFVAPFVETETGDKDGVPTALLEAMASGLPVVATTAGSIPEVIDDGVNGVLVAQRDSRALAQAVATLAADPGQRTALGTAGARTVREYFDVTVCDHLFHARVSALMATPPTSVPGTSQQVAP